MQLRGFSLLNVVQGEGEAVEGGISEPRVFIVVEGDIKLSGADKKMEEVLKRVRLLL